MTKVSRSKARRWNTSTDRLPPCGTQLTRPVRRCLPPVLGVSLESPVTEEVLLLREEMANMAWRSNVWWKVGLEDRLTGSGAAQWLARLCAIS